MKERLGSLALMLAKLREEKYKPLIISALEGMLAGSLLFLLYVSMWEDESIFAFILFLLLMLILPSALVLHLSYALPKKFADSWQKDKKIVACLTSVLLIYAYTILLLLLFESIISGEIFRNSTEETLFFIILPFYTFISYMIYWPDIMIFGLIPAIAVAFIATKGIGNKFARIIFALLLACLIFSVSVFPLPMTFGT
jgi:hypothetical protein